jgi:hypothetical protein
LVEPEPGLLRRFERRASASCFHARLEITNHGFTLGAGTVLAKMDVDAPPARVLGSATRRASRRC